jgi:asparagine synthase (glutamine-hydrolysing)
MLRYIALVWDSQESLAADRAAMLLEDIRHQRDSWKAAIDTLGLAVFFRSTCPTYPIQILPVGCGVIFGPLFHKPDPDRDDAAPDRATLSATDAERIIASDGRELISRYWGDYVGVFRQWNGRNYTVVRGPSAALRCLHAKASAVHVYFSDMEAYSLLVERTFTIDWLAVARTFLGPEPPGRTHIKGVRELPPGHCDQVSAGGVTSRILWNPLQLARVPQLGDVGESARILRNVTRACIHARASEYSSILMMLSGGLDSSITLSCLADAPSRPHVLCLTEYADNPDSDERHYARIAARAARCEVIQHLRDDIPDLRQAVYSSVLDMSPGLRIPQVDRIGPDIARAHRCQAIFDGNGGDEIFCRVHHWLYVCDYLRAKGFGGEFFPLLFDAAFTEGATVWTVLARSLFHALLPARLNVSALVAKDIHGATLLRRELIAEIIKDSRRQRSRSTLSPGRAWQSELMTARRSVPDPFEQPGDARRVSPLLSQPILETCFRIPTWYQSRDRRDRALARDAFASDVPREIITRYDKGGAEELASALIQRNLPFLREMLVNGCVASSGIVDRARLESALSDGPSSDGVSSVPIFDLLGAEIWARAWLERERPVAQKPLRTDRLYDGNSSRL